MFQSLKDCYLHSSIGESHSIFFIIWLLVSNKFQKRQKNIDFNENTFDSLIGLPLFWEKVSLLKDEVNKL